MSELLDWQIDTAGFAMTDASVGHYDFIVCGAGPAGCAVAARLAENLDVRVLLLEAGGSDAVPEVMTPGKWPQNLGSERDWGFAAQPNPHLNGRAIPLNMGKVLGGGSSINVMVWARGHRNDWEDFAAAAGDPAWGYESALAIYRRIENWQGAPDPVRRGQGGPVHVQTAVNPQPVAVAMLAAAKAVGLPVFDSPNGSMMEGRGGAAINELIVRAGQRYWHQCSTAKMGTDEMSVVDSKLKVYGIENLRIADASILPHVTSGNTMAPCVVVGERAAEVIKETHRL